MLSQIALMPILGLPAIVYGGLITFAILLMAGVIGWRTNAGKCKLKNPLKWHRTLVLIGLILTLGHALLGLSIFLGF